MTASVKAVQRDPFLSYGTQWLNDSANVGRFIVGVCGSPRPCASCSEQVSHSDTGVCLRCWNKWVGLLPLVATAFKQTLQRTMVWRYRTKLLTRKSLFGNKLFACCHVVVFVSLWKVFAGVWTTGAHHELREPMGSGSEASLREKLYIFLIVLNDKLELTDFTDLLPSPKTD